jgi:hypothetical protein
MFLCRNFKNAQFIFQVIFHYIYFTRARAKDRANSNQESHRVRR